MEKVRDRGERKQRKLTIIELLHSCHQFQVSQNYLVQCAGEGSMKIVEYIGTLKQSSEYFPLAKHGIYSADNDFLLLGIATRELNVTLIQEVFHPMCIYHNLHHN